MLPNEVFYLIYQYFLNSATNCVISLLLFRTITKCFNTWLYLNDKNEYAIQITNVDDITQYCQISRQFRFTITRHHSHLLIDRDVSDKLLYPENMENIYCHKDLECKTIQSYTNLIQLGCNNFISDSILKDFKKLKKLSLGNNNIVTDNVFKYLSNLEELSLDNNNKITDSGIYYLSKLLHLDLGHNKNVTHKSIEKLQFLKSINLKFSTQIAVSFKTELKKKSILVIDF